MSNIPNAEDIINAVGATAEMTWIFYSNLQKQGFNSVQALQLTHTYLSGIMTPVPPPNNKGPE